MNIRIKFVVLLGSITLLLTLAAAIGFMHQAHDQESTRVLNSITRERQQMLGQLVELNGQSLRNFSTDYSAWTEMVTFLRTGDLSWAAVNIDASLANFGAQVAWVLQPDGSLHYSANRTDQDSLRDLPFRSPAFLEALRTRKMLHFFQDSPAGLLEVRTAPIQPSEDSARATTPRGWWIIARLWDDTYVRQLARPLQCTATWSTPPGEPPGQPHVQLRQPFQDWNGTTIRTLYLDYQSDPLVELLAGNRRETRVLYGLGLAMVFLIAIGVFGWVIVPLNRLKTAMESENPQTLTGMRRGNSEFAHLARLVEQWFAQRAALRHELTERARIELRLRETEAGLRHSLELRGRLARDLHDGVIQSIYAAGLGLEGVRITLSKQPELADQQLSACQRALNETIAEVRSYITGLEPEQRTAQPFLFSEALTSLAASMEAFQQVKVQVMVDQATAQRLSPEQELNVLKFVRESLSNALRHAEAETIYLSLQPDAGGYAQLLVADDGQGFDPAQGPRTGRGLRNLTARAGEMGGVLHLDSSPGKGTRVSVRFKPAYPAQP